MNDVRDDWSRSAKAHAEAEAQRNESERLALAQLLVARGQTRGAALVALSDYRTDVVDNWNGGQYNAVLSVPASHIDLVVDGVRDAIASAAATVIGDAHFAGFETEVRLTEVSIGWDKALLEWLCCIERSARLVRWGQLVVIAAGWVPVPA